VPPPEALSALTASGGRLCRLGRSAADLTERMASGTTVLAKVRAAAREAGVPISVGRGQDVAVVEHLDHVVTQDQHTASGTAVHADLDGRGDHLRTRHCTTQLVTGPASVRDE
jgi:hypothetical protein